HFRKRNGKWEVVDDPDLETLHKRHGLQGPIDDAFMDSFLMVRPTGRPASAQVGEWVKGELGHALTHWRRQFRGDARVKDDSAGPAEDIRAHHLVLWGDPSGNSVLAKLAGKLPIRWSGKEVRVGKETFDAAHHAPVLIHPNPLNPK